MPNFDLDAVRSQLDGVIGYKYYLDLCVNEATKQNALSGTADAMIGQSIRCILVGYDEQGCQLLSKANDWLIQAIDANEKPRRYFRGGTESQRHSNLALCSWLLKNDHDVENLQEAVRWEEMQYSEQSIDSKSVALSLSLYLDAHQFARCYDLYDKTFNGRLSPSNNISEAGLAYLLAKHELGGLKNETERLDGISANFIKQRIPELLADGRYNDMARWAKVLLWNDKPNPPRATVILKAILNKSQHTGR
jgi:hypothetical protein